MTADFFETGRADARDLQQLGITRVGDITGLDRIGLPVWFACRPNSRALSVSQGKGMNAAQARISAIMEAAECAIAERAEDVVDCFATLRTLQQRDRRTIPTDRIMRCVTDELDPDREYAWVSGIAMQSGTEILAPYELVGLDMRAKAPWDHQIFKMSSIGLAAGGEADRTLLHALLEVVEHNATAALDLFGAGARTLYAVRQQDGVNRDLDQAIARVVNAGFTPQFFALPSNVPLPVIACFMERTILSDDGAGATLTAGFACRLDAHDAALAALLECVQSRATDIAGSRDDITAADYRKSLARLPAGSSATVPLCEVAGHRAQSSLATPAATLEHVINTILVSGAGDVFVFPLATALPGLQVTRVLVPGLDVAGTNGVSRVGASLIDALLRAG
ncbi:MAG: YcaO-like family protein [Rhodospirillaceae bacterium]|nr:YcaO-like family protein [Rhodospirillaceae bacterium]